MGGGAGVGGKGRVEVQAVREGWVEVVREGEGEGCVHLTFH